VACGYRLPLEEGRFQVMKILVPVDGSRPSIAAVKFAIDQARAKAGTSLVLVNVQNVRALAVAEGASFLPSGWAEQQRQQRSEEALQEAISGCRDAGVTFTTRSEGGAIAATLDRVAREEGVAQIIMGTRGLGGVGGLLLGSVGTQILHLSDVPVTFVR
jgi:nucleotide-binding universal stress UspA family protein